MYSQTVYVCIYMARTLHVHVQSDCLGMYLDGTDLTCTVRLFRYVSISPRPYVYSETV